MVTSIKVFFLTCLTSLCAFEHTTYINPITSYEHERFYHGIELRAEQLQAFDNCEIYAQPSWRQYHKGDFIGSGVMGFRYTAMEPVIGVNMGYDLSAMSPRILQQMSWGLEFRDEIVELHIRHYRPWPRVTKANGTEIVSYPHTDIDFHIKDDYFHVGFGFFYAKIDNEDEIGFKTSLKTFFNEYGLSFDWKWDMPTKHCYTLGFTWNFPVQGKKSFNNQSHIVYKETKFAPRQPPSPLATSPVVKVEAPSSPEPNLYTVEIPDEPLWEVVDEIKDEETMADSETWYWKWLGY